MRKELELPGSLSVFNMHVNNAGQRALHVCRACFGGENADLRSLERMYETGIMEIFTRRPNPVTRLFEHACFIFANGLDRVDVLPEPGPCQKQQA